MPDELSSNDHLVKVNVDLEVFRHVASISGLYFGLSLFLMKVSVSLVGTHDHFAGFWNTSSFWCWNQAVLFPIIAPLSQSIVNAINYRFFSEKRLGKKNRRKFWNQNRYQKCSIVLTQFVSKPGDRKCLSTYWEILLIFISS